MEASILIVSKNRSKELEFTLGILEKMIDFSKHEVLVFLDGCTDNSLVLLDKLKWIRWFYSEKSIGASAARHQLYPKANGHYLIGLDDDAHPLNEDFILQTRSIFQKKPNLGIIAFQEIRGVFNSDKAFLVKSENKDDEYYTNEFIGCGFAVRKDVYNSINGFPVWIDIYGEESCVAIEVMNKGFDILYTNKVKINHRVNKEERITKGHNYFRFGKQLKNTTYYYLVYYPNPSTKIVKLYWHNFKKYALTDFNYFKIFFSIILEVLVSFPKVIKYRNPVDLMIIKKRTHLSRLKF